MAKSLAEYLSRKNFEVAFAASQEESLRTVRSFDPGLVLLDYSLPPTDGNDTLERLKQLRPETPVIVYSGDAAPDAVFRLSKLGAEDYIAVPFQLNDLLSRISRALEKRAATDGDGQLRDRVRRQSDFSTLFGTSPRMEEIKDTIEQVAETSATVLIRGESGTGKTMAAEVLANDLQLDLYKIDLSKVVNKYIGETEKNLKRVFDAAEDGGAILLFDEDPPAHDGPPAEIMTVMPFSRLWLTADG